MEHFHLLLGCNRETVARKRQRLHRKRNSKAIKSNWPLGHVCLHFPIGHITKMWQTRRKWRPNGQTGEKYSKIGSKYGTDVGLFVRLWWLATCIWNSQKIFMNTTVQIFAKLCLKLTISGWYNEKDLQVENSGTWVCEGVSDGESEGVSVCDRVRESVCEGVCEEVSEWVSEWRNEWLSVIHLTIHNLMRLWKLGSSVQQWAIALSI